MKHLTFNLFFLLSVLILSCNRPACENKNSVFANHAPETEEYKGELVRQLQKEGYEKLTFWFDEYKSKNEKDYIQVDIQGEDFCAKGLILVNDWTNLEGIKQTSGEGYKGAELRGMQIDVKQDSMQTEFVLKKIDSVID